MICIVGNWTGTYAVIQEDSQENVILMIQFQHDDKCAFIKTIQVHVCAHGIDTVDPLEKTPSRKGRKSWRQYVLRMPVVPCVTSQQSTPL